MFIPILFLTLTLASADVMTLMESEPQPSTTESRPSMPPINSGKPSVTEKPGVELNPGETVKVKAEQFNTVNPVELKLEKRIPPGRVGSNCIDCAISNLPKAMFSVKVPKLNINFEVSDFPSSRLIFATLAQRVKSIPFIESLSFPSDIQRMQLRALGDVEVLIFIPKFGWKQILKLSDVVSGFDIPKIPSIAPKVESCVGDCLNS
ncbi:putative 2b protein [Tobacco streak virus]|uniref:Suppressor of silencing 2b n=1 Tax=Tobacco streak virus (strain WC) TaxID=12318 RepID=2B_TOBSV|nr:putative 2b protein [Tobacco streak virus]P89679.1 RecName: Full=Suppressor of silencing 2b; AltName: Full=Protein 2b [Tobacco streak virus (strain WC)]AAB48410.1 putative 2b protein [Tobacco streak virus]